MNTQDMAIIIFTYGSTVAYIVVIGDTLPPLAELIGLDADAFYTQRWFLMFIATATLIFPLALLKQLSSLRFTAILGFCATLYLLSAMFYRVAEQFQFVGGMEVIQNVEMAQINLNFFVAAPIVFYAFSSHVNIFSISNELRNPTPQRIDTVILGNVLLAMLVYGMIGLCGYLTFLDETDDNVINNYDTVLALNVLNLDVCPLINSQFDAPSAVRHPNSSGLVSAHHGRHPQRAIKYAPATRHCGLDGVRPQ